MAAALTAAGSAAQAAGPTHLPLAAGSAWYLADAETAAGTTISVRRGGSGSFLRGFPGAGDLRVRRAGAAVQAWDEGQKRWEPFLRLGAPAGTRYVVDLSSAPLWRRVLVSVASRDAAVEDARGRERRGCVVLRLSPPKGVADAGIEELAFAPGVGPVRVVETTIAGSRTRLLDRYVPGATR
jgi:hypothetical protein